MSFKNAHKGSSENAVLSTDPEGGLGGQSLQYKLILVALLLKLCTAGQTPAP